jgi:hypothetical protein
VADYEQLDLGPKPSHVKPGRVWRALAGPGHVVGLAEAAELAERAYAESDMGVLAVKETEFGWLMALQGRRYISTRDFNDMLLGHGLTIVDRNTGDMFCSGSATPSWAAVLGYLEKRLNGDDC